MPSWKQAAALLVGAALLFAGVVPARAQNVTEQENDLDVLNYLLYVEEVQYAFFNNGLAFFTATDFADAGFNGTIYEQFGVISQQTGKHVLALKNAIEGANGTAHTNCTYDFNSTLASVDYFVATARDLKNTSVAAFVGVSDYLFDLSWRTLTASMATVEARHSAYILVIDDEDPFPSAFDAGETPGNVTNGLNETPFIVSCPFNVTLPVPPADVAEPTPTETPTGTPSGAPTTAPTQQPTTASGDPRQTSDSSSIWLDRVAVTAAVVSGTIIAAVLRQT